MNRLIFSLLFFCTFGSLQAKSLNEEKVLEAIARASLQMNDCFFAEKIDAKQMGEAGFDSAMELNCVPYHLVVKNILPRTEFEIYTSNLNNIAKPTFICPGYINDQGDAIIYQGDEELKLSNVFMGGMVMRGEPIYHLFISKNRKIYLASIFTAYPIEGFGKNGRHTWMEMASPNADKYLLHGKNFSPEESVSITYRHDGQNETVKLKASKGGNFGYILKNGSKKHSKTDVLISSEQGGEICLQYEWGFSPNQTKGANQ